MLHHTVLPNVIYDKPSSVRFIKEPETIWVTFLQKKKNENKLKSTACYIKI